MIMIRMRAKVCFLACVLFSIGFLAVSDHKQQSIKTIVQETQNQLDNLKKNFKDQVRGERMLKVDQKYLDKLMSDDHWLNDTSNVIILTSVTNGRAGEAVHFVRNAQMFMPNFTIVMYDMGLSSHESDLVGSYCNVTCHLRPFDPEGFYTTHVRKFSKPVIIQETLKLGSQSLIYMDIDQRFITKDVAQFLTNTTNMGGISAWLRDDSNIPTSAMTHPKMFEYLVEDKDQVENFNFQHMVSSRVLIIDNTPVIRENVLKHWVECTLLQDCIEPIGSQSTGCRFDKKPQYRYSGCHDYDVSALNVLLGVTYQFDESRYLMSDKFFSTVTDEDVGGQRKSNSQSFSFVNETGHDAIDNNGSVTTVNTINESFQNVLKTL